MSADGAVRTGGQSGSRIAQNPIIPAVSDPEIAGSVEGETGPAGRERQSGCFNAARVGAISGEGRLPDDHVGELEAGGLGERFWVAQDAIISAVGYVKIPGAVYREAGGAVQTGGILAYVRALAEGW